MCVIILRPENKVLSTTVLLSCMHDNPHGWGMMYALNGRVHTLRGLEDSEFWSAYMTIPASVTLAIHFRIKTHGKINIANTHPFPVLPASEGYLSDIWLMHNGIFRIEETDPSMSDTWHFVQHLLKPVLVEAPVLLHNAAFQGMLEDSVDSSRVLLLDGSGTFVLLNSKSWTEEEGCLFSNNHSLYADTYYKPTKKKKSALILPPWGNAQTGDGVIMETADESVDWATDWCTHIMGLNEDEVFELICDKFDTMFSLLKFLAEDVLSESYYNSYPQQMVRELIHAVAENTFDDTYEDDDGINEYDLMEGTRFQTRPVGAGTVKAKPVEAVGSALPWPGSSMEDQATAYRRWDEDMKQWRNPATGAYEFGEYDSPKPRR